MNKRYETLHKARAAQALPQLAASSLAALAFTRAAPSSLLQSPEFLSQPTALSPLAHVC